MIFKHKPLADSDVMQEFERIAISKGMAKAEVMSKTASKESVNLAPGKDLIIDMLNLAEGLRNKGFEKEAGSLEEKVLIYKRAETHLYRAIDEDADDMLDFAHPKKNRVKFDAKDGHGEFEDTRSQHDKMIAIVNKKVASECNSALEKTAEILGLKKKADFNSLDPVDAKIADINYSKSQLIKILNQKPCFYFATRDSLLYGTDAVLFFGEGGYKAFPLIDGNKEAIEVKGVPFLESFLDYFKSKSKPVIGPDTWKSFTSGSSTATFDDIITDEKINNANGMLQSLYADYLNKVKSLPEIKKENGVVDVNSVNKFLEVIPGLFDDKSEVILLALIGDDEKLESEIKDKIIPKMIAEAKGLLESAPKATGMDEIFDTGWVNVIAGRFDQLFESATNAKDSDPSYFKKIADIIKANVNKPYRNTYDQLVNFDKDLASATDKNKLDSWAQEWQQHFTKKASKSNEIVKEARTIPTENSAPTQPASYTQIRSRVNQPVSNNSVKSTFQQNNTDEYDAVSKMQTALQRLAESLPQLFPKKDPKVLEDWSSKLISTGYGDKGPKAEAVDGEWGPATERALNEAQSILTEAGLQTKLFTPAQRIKGQAQQDPKEIINAAKANSDVIYSTLNEKQIQYKGKDQPKTNVDDNSPYIDSLPADTNIFGPITTNEDPKSGIALSKDDLSSFYGLFKFLRIHGLTKAQGFTTDDWEKVILWFFGRANKQFIETKSKSKGIYQALLQKLYGVLEDYTQNNKDSAGKLVSAKEIDGQNPSSVQKSTGPTQNASTNTEAEGGSVENMHVNKVSNAPFGYTFVPEELHSQFGSVMGDWKDYHTFINSEIPFDVNDFEYDPRQVQNKYIKLNQDQVFQLTGVTNKSAPPTPKVIQGAYLFVMRKVCNGLSNDLYNVLVAWKHSQDQNSQALNNAYTAWNKWSPALSEMISRIDEILQTNGPLLTGIR